MNKEGNNVRLNPSFWRHDWYSLVKLREAIEQVVYRKKSELAGKKILDIGCGDCPYEPIFRTYGCEYIGCDIAGNPDLIIQIEKKIPLPDNSFDCIVSFQVLEHVWNLDWYLGECYRLLKPGGWLLLSTHGNWLYHPIPGDYRRWTREGLVKEINSHGFNLENVAPVLGPLAWTTQFRLFGYYHALQKLGLFGSLLLVPLSWLMNLRMIIEDLITPAEIRDVNASIYVTLSHK